VVSNSIGFDTLLAGYTNPNPPQIFKSDYTLKGSMNIGLTNVFIKSSLGIWLPLTSGDAMLVGDVGTNGSNVDVNYSLALP